jgi:lipopolysaccharide biosynthesis regulator YciM
LHHSRLPRKVLNPLREVVNDHKQAITKLQAQRKKPSKDGIEILEYRLQQAEVATPIHELFFEKFKLKSMKNIIETILLSEIQYHCKALEELSPVLELLHSLHVDE